MELVDVSLAERSYQIKIGNGLLTNPSFCSLLTTGVNVVIVSNTVVAPLYLAQLEKNLIDNGVLVDHLILPDGERVKSLDSIEKIMTYLLEKQYGRDVFLLALGGGVIGDLIGFSAAIFQRGVRFIQVPTTLLAQVDSSVGGKTGVNHPLGKNMVGAFYQPKQVVIDLDTLKTLSTRQFSAGLAEVIKYGVILDSLFFEWLENNIALLMKQDKEALTYCIKRCCELKAAVVVQDEKERSGLRELLNLGHTFGHAIETFFEYKAWLHGEAVAIGMVMAAELSCEKKMLSSLEKERIVSLLVQAQLPVKRPINMPIDAYLPLMLRDKKNRHGVLRLILPNGLGRGAGIAINDEEQVLNAIRAC